MRKEVRMSELAVTNESANQINGHVLNSGFQRLPVVRNGLGKNAFVSCESLNG